MCYNVDNGLLNKPTKSAGVEPVCTTRRTAGRQTKQVRFVVYSFQYTTEARELKMSCMVPGGENMPPGTPSTTTSRYNTLPCILWRHVQINQRLQCVRQDRGHVTGGTNCKYGILIVIHEPRRPKHVRFN